MVSSFPVKVFGKLNHLVDLTNSERISSPLLLLSMHVRGACHLLPWKYIEVHVKLFEFKCKVPRIESEGEGLYRVKVQRKVQKFKWFEV